jgi:Tol biopolymer transport system component
MTGYEELGPVVGRGGAVRARRLSDGAEVVLKRLPGAGSEAWLGQVARRAEWLARMDHPALPRIYEVTAEESGLVIVMEYAAGGSLAGRLARGRMRPGVVAELFSTLGEGLEVAHRAGVLHLDLKPSNILFRANGDAFLSDFGHDRLLETTSQPTPGAAEYLDPAVAEGTPPDAQTDLYALAAISYEALTGSPPFSGESVVEVAEALRGDPLRPVADVAGDLPALLAGAVERALERRRERRYPSAGAFAEALLPGQGTVLPPLPTSDVLPPLPPPEAVAVPWFPAPEEPEPAGRGRALGRWPVGAAVLAAVILVAALVAVPTLLHVVGLHGTPTTHLLVGPASSSPEPTPTVASLPMVEVPTSTPPGPSPSPSPHPTPAAAKPGPVPAARRPIPATAPAPAFVPSRAPIPAPPLPPKGQRIAFTGTKDGRPSIYVTDPVGSVVNRLTNSPVGEDSQPAWSPDGTRIAFTSTRDGSRQIYLMNADGSNQHRLTVGAANNYDPAWDPTSATIAYVSDQTGTPEVYAIGALGGTGQYAGPAPIQNYAHSTFAQPAFSPDGQTLAATTLTSGTMIVTWKVSGALIAGLNSPPIPHVENPAWSPSGSQIAYGSSDGKVQVWVMAPDGSGKLALTAGPSNNAEPRFSPTGDRIVFVSDRVGLRQVWAMSPDGSHQAPVVNVAGETYDPSWG